MSGRFFAENILSDSSKRFMPHFTVLFFTSAPAVGWIFQIVVDWLGWLCYLADKWKKSMLKIL